MFNLTEEEKAEMYKAMAQQISSEYEFKYQDTAQQVLVKLFETPAFIKLFGKVTLQTTTKELLKNPEALKHANEIIEQREKVAEGLEDETFEIIQEGLKGEMGEFLNKPKYEPKYLAGLTYREILSGYDNPMTYFESYLVKSYPNGFEIHSWDDVISKFEMIVYGSTVFNLRSRLRNGVSFIAKGNDLSTAELPTPGEPTKTEQVIIDTSLQYIDPDLQARYLQIEIKAAAEIRLWRQSIDAIRCAAFCSMLFDKNYFLYKKTKRKTLTKFAKLRWGIDIEKKLEGDFPTHIKNHIARKVDNQEPMINYMK